MDSRTIDVVKDSERIGWYRVDKGMITVTSAKNSRSKTTRAAPGDNEGLARLMLHEPWAS
ncbi:hypothetical protein AD942_07330 [Gluconobacter japonicus]|uniref:hypothetical protein n=1 Tax=Gluconobacter japonicus TaxID=376620 RepID=UPI000782D843|nr:hypothetical protein [Gluconobacter japonicus]KXV26178.1 hypothetical protein AD936_20320 [Gluconobacter japonicus]KXV40077.1 hypothetical protein AD942_07330 [Gluconobacter japonicus]